MNEQRLNKIKPKGKVAASNMAGMASFRHRKMKSHKQTLAFEASDQVLDI